MTAAHQYATWVLDPDNVRETGRLIKLAAQRFLNDLKRDDIYFDEVEAVKIVDMCEANLLQWEGDWEGLPMKFEPWQRFHLEQMYGWIRKGTGTRRFNEVYVQIAKKNGKSTESAAVMLGHVFFDEKVNTPKVFTAANNQDQAKICVNMAGQMIKASPAFACLIDQKDGIQLGNYLENVTEVINRENNGFIKSFSKETSDSTAKTSGGKHGINASLGVVDEFGMSPDHGASKSIKTSMASRRERLMFYITTAGYNLEGPCFTELRAVGIKVLEGSLIKDNYLPIIYEIDPPKNEKGEDDKITVQWLKSNEWAWRQANPNLDKSVQREFLRETIEDAITYGGKTETDGLTLNFNVWMHSPQVWIPADVWDKNAFGLPIEDGESCYAGIEVGSSGECIAVALLFPGEITKVKMLFILAEDSLKFNEFYRDNKASFILDPGNEVDNDLAVQWIIAEFQRYNLHSFAFPTTHKNNSIIQGLIKNGYQGNPISQGMSGIANPTSEWEKLVRAVKVDHGNNQVLKWMNSNCMAVKKESGTRVEKNGKVLGIYACINAVAQWKTVDANGINSIGILSI